MLLYDWIKALHLISVFAWMAGMFYLPRLYVYHSMTTDAATKETFKVMERRLLRVIINPAMVAAFIFGGWMIWDNPDLLYLPWMQVKLALALALTGLHGMLARWRKDFAANRNHHTEKFYRIINEIPTVLLIGIVIMVIVKPF